MRSRITEAKEAEVLKRAKQEEEQTKKVEEEAKKQQDILMASARSAWAGRTAPDQPGGTERPPELPPEFLPGYPLALPKPPSSPAGSAIKSIKTLKRVSA